MRGYDNVGDPEEYNTASYRDPSFPNRPTNGFVEERVLRLECQVGNLESSSSGSDITNRLDTIDNSLTSFDCICCKKAKPDFINGHRLFPICNTCISTIGEISKVKDSWILK